MAIRNNIYNNLEINFETGLCEETLDSKLSFIINRLNSFNNPYIGNKRKLIFDIFRAINKYKIEYNSVLDLFAGSGYVSMAMKMMGKEVYSNDILLSSYMNIKAFVENNDTILTEEEKEEILLKENFDDKLDNILKKYSNKFTNNEIKLINRCYSNIEKKYNFDDIKYSLFVSNIQNYIMDRCFVGGRLNNGQVLAELNHRLNHVKNKNKKFSKKRLSFKPVSIDWAKPISSYKKKCKSYNLDVFDLLRDINPKVDLCYIDPPYGGDQSDYDKMYNFFEDCLYKHSYKSEKDKKDVKKFVNKKKYEANFSELLSLISYIPWIVISYNNSSWMDIDYIVKIIKKFRRKVKINKVQYDYNYRKRSEKSEEYIIVAN